MMTGRHYDDEALISLIGASDIAPDDHVITCPSCSSSLSSYRQMAGTLSHESVWSRETVSAPPANVIGTLRSFAAQLENESETARGLVEALLQRPRETWSRTVLEDGRYQTAGVVRQLIEENERRVAQNPAEALELGALSSRLAEDLELDDYPQEVVLKLRGRAAMHLAFARYYVGDPTRALVDAERAQSCFEECVVADYEMARLAIVKATILGLAGRFREGLAEARKSGRLLRDIGDRWKLISAYSAEGFVLMCMEDYRAALTVFRRIEEEFRDVLEPVTRSIVVGNIATCLWKTGKIAEALQTFSVAAALDEASGRDAEAARNRYNVATLLLDEGHHEEAERRFRNSITEFERLGMEFSATWARLSLAETLLLVNQPQEVDGLCRAALQQLESSGLVMTEQAMMVLGFLREAAEQKRLTVRSVRQARIMVENLPDRRPVLYAPKPFEG